MAIQLAVDIRNARANLIESMIGASPVLKIRSGAPPANVAAADTGTVLSTLTLPVDWLTAAANGVVTKVGTWEDLTADAEGISGHFRLYQSDGVTQKMQGTVTGTGAGGDMTVSNTDFATDQPFSITSFTLTEANA